MSIPSYYHLAQILRSPEPWTTVEMLESELRELVYQLAGFVFLPDSTAEDVERAVEKAITFLEERDEVAD